MFRNRALALVLTLVLMMAVSTVVFASSGGAPVSQDGMEMPTETPAATEETGVVYSTTPQPGMMNGTMNSGSMAMGTCPMMSGMSGMGSMSGMSDMTGMGSMSGMTSMNGMTGGSGMSMMNMSGMQGMVEEDPYAWLRNPWLMLGWLLFGLTMLAVLAGIVLGVLWIIRRSSPAGPVAAP